MATYKRQLKDKDGNIIIPATGVTGDYSTTEQDTGYTWVDGRHIYKKTINFGELPNNTAKSVAHGISGLDYVIKYDCMVDMGTGTWFSLPSVSFNNVSLQIDITITTDNVRIQCLSDRSTNTCYVTIYYVKTS